MHSVTKYLGRGHQRKLVLDSIDCVIPRQSHYAILGQRGAGKTTFLHILSGAQTPTSGWLERRATISATTALARYGSGLTTPRQLAHRLAKVYYADPGTVGDFVERFSGLGRAMDVPTRFLARHGRQKLGFALFYSLPCDFYLYDGAINTKLPDMKDRVQQAYLQRRREAGMIFVTSQPRAARVFGGKGGIIHGGKLTLFDSVEDAIAVYERLPAVHFHGTPPNVAEILDDAEEVEN